jgi:hypothetical protein
MGDISLKGALLRQLTEILQIRLGLLRLEGLVLRDDHAERLVTQSRHSFVI